MAVQDHVGRIDKEAFLVSLSVFLALAIIGVIGRFVVRFGIQKSRLQLEDGLLILALIFLLASQIIIYHQVIDPMFLMMALQMGTRGIQIPLNVIDMGIAYHKWTTAALMLSWCSISTVKFFFLVFFRRLIDRLRSWQIYWWIVFAYNVFLLVFGIVEYYAGCPHLGIRGTECETGAAKNKLVRYSAAQITLDIVGDLLILAIPIGIIWNVKVNLRQKLVLACSLCLTIVLVALSITRVAGIEYKNFVDSVWETYWQSMSAELGVFLAAASAFRGFFVSHKQNKASTPQYNQISQSFPGKTLIGSGQRQIEVDSDVDSRRRMEDLEVNEKTSTSSIEAVPPSLPRVHVTDGYFGYVEHRRSLGIWV